MKINYAREKRSAYQTEKEGKLSYINIKLVRN